jgi:Lrp/AsnC family leucine-responsive transcriptional regulator
MSEKNIKLDKLDNLILRELMKNGRMSWSELAQLLDLSSPSTSERVRRLEEAGVIQGYTAIINPEAVDCGLESFIFVTLGNPDSRQPFIKQVHRDSSVLECHHIAGDSDYLLKVRSKGTRELENLISRILKGIKGVVRTKTTIVLSTVKETVNLPMPVNEEQ